MRVAVDVAELIPGDPEAIARLIGDADRAAHSAATNAKSLRGLRIERWSGDAAAFHLTAAAEASTWDALANGFGRMAAALRGYADAFGTARAQAGQAVAALELASTPAEQQEAAALLTAARARLDRAGDTAAALFQELDAARPDVNTGWGALSIGTMSTTKLASFAKRNLGLASALRTMGPEAIAAWWAGLTPTKRAQLVEALPEVVGSLEGVDAASRSRANQTVLARQEARLKRIGTDDPGYEAARKQLAAIAAIRNTLGAHPERRHPPLQLLTLELGGGAPLAAIAVGDLDTADHVTYNIPGMQTTVAKDIKGWTEASKNLYYQQEWVASRKGQYPNLSVVSWIGYEAPQDVLAENGSDAARAGGDALAKALRGTLAARGWPPRSARLSVVGFSYGSAVAGAALKDASAGTFVSVGSAGIAAEAAPGGRTTVRTPLNVPAGGISSGQASGDATATWGRLLSGRDDPSVYGATSFSTDDAHLPDGTPTAGTTDHAATVHTSAPDAYGYYDKDTTALNNIAAESLGFSDRLAE